MLPEAPFRFVHTPLKPEAAGLKASFDEMIGWPPVKLPQTTGLIELLKNILLINLVVVSKPSAKTAEPDAALLFAIVLFTRKVRGRCPVPESKLLRHCPGLCFQR